MSGAPTTTPSAYALMMCPAVGTETPRSAATFGSNPIMTNSPVPMPKPPTPSASSAHPERPARPATALPVEYVECSRSLKCQELVCNPFAQYYRDGRIGYGCNPLWNAACLAARHCK